MYMYADCLYLHDIGKNYDGVPDNIYFVFKKAYVHVIPVLQWWAVCLLCFETVENH